jgi:hypothetical protein
MQKSHSGDVRPFLILRLKTSMRSAIFQEGTIMRAHQILGSWTGLLLAVPVVGTAALAVADSGRGKTAPTDDLPALIGDWTGDSTCQVKQSACRDEKALYRIAQLSDRPGWVSITFDKIVDGRPVTMGALPCKDEDGTLTCEYDRGVWKLAVKGNQMTGTLTTPDGTVFRRVTLKKDQR